MKKEVDGQKQKGIPLLFSIVLVFCVLGTVVLAVSHRISQEMANSAIQNLSESLDLIQHTMEYALQSEAEFQKLLAREAAASGNPEAYVKAFEKNQTMVQVSFIRQGEEEGVSNTGEAFLANELDFSSGKTVNGLPVSRSYLNHLGTWAYTLQCPVEQDGQELGTLYVEYIYDSLERALPTSFYNHQSTLYVMDAESQRFVLKPKGVGKRNAGHLNLEDFYRANGIEESGLRAEMQACLEGGDNILFYHDVRNTESLNYMWAVNGGSIFLIGYVPIKAIQQEGDTVNQNIFIVVAVMLVAFSLCFLLYYLNKRQQDKIRKEREAEREVHSRQLAEALQAAQIASNSKTTFLSNMSHDIRTPMNAVLGFTTLLAMDAGDPAKVREYTKKIMSSGQHLLSLINDVLDVSKIESGKVVLNFDTFTLNSLVSSVDAIIQPMAKAKGQAFHVEVSGIKHEELVGDETRVNQILLNLLSNAVKYTPEGGSIWFRMLGQKQRSSQYERIRIEVEDNGYGMSPEYLKIIFNAFTRAENSTTNKVQGTGLGMAITKSIVELMGGTIDVESQEGKGSLFRVELEFRIPEGQGSRQFWEENGLRQVLAVSGSPDALGDISALLAEAGVDPKRAQSPAEALDLLHNGFSCQAALVDWESLPGEGAQAVRDLRGALPSGALVFLLAEYDAQGMEEALALEDTALLTKPFFVSAFKEKVRELRGTGREKASQEAPESNVLDGLHFLAAEDNEINAEILSELLEIEGATVEIVENGQLAVERFRQAGETEFDAILMDVQMPVMNGYDATRHIRSLDRPDAGRIPIIAMTANAFAEDEKAALDAGMDAHVAKPIRIDLLKKAIWQHTGERSQT